MMLLFLLCVVVIGATAYEATRKNADSKNIIKCACVFVIATACALFLLTSCSRTVYVPVTSTKTEYKDRLRVDSTYLHDSIYIMKLGDTIYNKVYRTKYQIKYMRDSIHLTDTIRQPYPVEVVKEVKKPLNWYEKMCLWGFSLILAAGVGYVTHRLIKII